MLFIIYNNMIYIYIFINVFSKCDPVFAWVRVTCGTSEEKKRGPVAWCQGAPTMVDVQPPTGVIL